VYLNFPTTPNRAWTCLLRAAPALSNCFNWQAFYVPAPSLFPLRFALYWLCWPGSTTCLQFSRLLVYSLELCLVLLAVVGVAAAACPWATNCERLRGQDCSGNLHAMFSIGRPFALNNAPPCRTRVEPPFSIPGDQRLPLPARVPSYGPFWTVSALLSGELYLLPGGTLSYAA